MQARPDDLSKAISACPGDVGGGRGRRLRGDPEAAHAGVGSRAYERFMAVAYGAMAVGLTLGALILQGRQARL